MISDATGGLPRYCHPYHGGWDVARIALNIPESRILFICPVSCARIICLNALKYGYKDRIDVLALTEADIVSGNYEEKTIEAACEVLETVKPRPKALILYVSCIDAMLGNDHTFQTEEIMNRYPDVNCFVLKMCPITRYSGDLPLSALQHDMYDALPKERVEKEKIVTFIGTNISLDPENELVRILKEGGFTPLHIQGRSEYDDYLKVRASSLNLCLMPFGKSAGELLKDRYDTPWLPYFAKYNFTAIKNTLTSVCESLSIPVPDLESMEEETIAHLKETAAYIQGTPLTIDSTATLFPDDLRNILTSCGFQVLRVYADGISRTAPDVDSGHIRVPLTRSFSGNKKIIGIGPVAATFEGAEMMVNCFYDNGEWGFYGLKKLSERIRKAYDDLTVSDLTAKGGVS